MFTRQHFEAIAEILYQYGHVVGRNNDFDQGAEWAVSNVTEELANLFQKDNPRFDRQKFFEAAGVDKS